MNSTTTTTKGTITEVQIDGHYAGIVVQGDGVWEARHEGVKTTHPTFEAARHNLEENYEETRVVAALDQDKSYETDTVTIHNLFESWVLDADSTKADVVVHLPGGFSAKISAMSKVGPQVYMGVWYQDFQGQHVAQILTPTHVKISWVCY